MPNNVADLKWFQAPFVPILTVHPGEIIPFPHLELKYPWQL